MRKRVLEVEQKIAAGNRENLLGTTPTSEKREKVSSAEAGTRLRSVNNMIGGIINQGQVNTILLRFTSTEGVVITPEKNSAGFFFRILQKVIFAEMTFTTQSTRNWR